MTDPEIQFTAPGTISLVDALRGALGSEGLGPSRKRVRAWIGAGRVRVGGQVARDPALLLRGGEVIDLVPAEEESAPARGAPQSAARGTEGILHLDRHLLVAVYEPPVVVRANGDEVEIRLRQALDEAAVSGLRPRPVPAPDARTSGIVAAALSGAAEEALARAFAAGEAALALVAVVEAGEDADLTGLRLEEDGGGGLRIVAEAVASVPAFLADLARRDVTVRPVPGAGPATGRPLLVHVTGLHLPHPRTGRTLAWRLGLPPGMAPPGHAPDPR